MIELHLGSLGEVQGKTPNSLATCFDFVNTWVSQPPTAQLFRLHAAAIGACNTTSKLPAYPYMKADPIGYGHGVLERLLDAGVKPAEVWEMGGKCLSEMLKKTSFGSEVEEKEDFS